MANVHFNTYLATYNAAGHVVSIMPAPAPEIAKQRTLVIRAKNSEQAEELAKALFSLAK